MIYPIDIALQWISPYRKGFFKLRVKYQTNQAHCVEACPFYVTQAVENGDLGMKKASEGLKKPHCRPKKYFFATDV
jgi:hypothetical protein